MGIIEEVGVTCVLVTHDQEEAMTMASTIAVMDEGTILQTGTPDEVYERPNSRQVAEFIGDVNIFEGQIETYAADHVRIRSEVCVHYLMHGISGHVGLSVVVAVRPEKIVLSKKRPAGEVNWCVGEVVALVYFGDHTIYHIQLANAQVIKAQQMNRTTDLAEAITSGDRVYASWSGLALVVLVQ